MKRQYVLLGLGVALFLGAGAYASVTSDSSGPAGYNAGPFLPSSDAPGISHCGRTYVMAGLAGSHGTALASCASWVGLATPTVITAAVGETVFVQINGVTKQADSTPTTDPKADEQVRFEVSPAGAATVVGWTVIPLQAKRITVNVTGLDCASVPPKDIQPKTCTLMVVDAR